MVRLRSSLKMLDCYMVEKKGLFVIRATGDGASIINMDNFIPKAW